MAHIFLWTTLFQTLSLEPQSLASSLFSLGKTKEKQLEYRICHSARTPMGSRFQLPVFPESLLHNGLGIRGWQPMMLFCEQKARMANVFMTSVILLEVQG